ncbi:hypothetical protein LSTR_LSTR008007 [Laodelphax striatellus]|uniref:N-acetyltransferase domain-containing protein n=1 Tax=Laodelphax striatellus TaxID=195883 RepID=A0A482WJW7_LAOST|nr:hypothetical protein LSTR_LSTR008007 [Laodelphax striatellus]
MLYRFLNVLRDARSHRTINQRLMSSLSEKDVYEEYRPSEGVAILQARKGYKPIMRQFLELTYLKNDPLLLANGLSNETDLLDHWLDEIEESLSVMAVDKKSGKVIGVAAGSECTPESAEKSKEVAARTIKNTNAFRMACLFADLPEKTKLFERFRVRNMFEVNMIGTHPDYRQQGLGKYMLLHLRALARRAGYPLLRIDCSSHFSARMALRQGMEKLSERKVTEYTDQDKKPWAAVVPPPPHSNFVVCFERLDPSLATFFKKPPLNSK